MASRSALVCLCWILGCGDDSSPGGGSTGDADASSSASTAPSDDSSSSGGPPLPEEAIVEATIDATAACGGATMVAFVAARFACVSAGPCTVSDPPTEIEGTSFACPSDAGETTVSVTLTQGGRYHVELVADLDNGAQVRECYSVDGSFDEVVIDDAELTAGEPIIVTGTGSPCPL
jgi:hypothetical protein